ncbi:MAG TPA: DUF4912 domain-containing protein, partial [Polyangia bacterium]
DELGKLKLEALRLLAAERGVEGARNLGKAELIDLLAPKSVVERTKDAIAHAVEVVKSVVASDAPPEKPAPRTHPANGFGVPSATVHPHAAPPSAGEPIGMLDFEELPETYGVDECEVLFKDPFWVFAYWEVTDGGLASARAQLGASADSAHLVMRMFTTMPGSEGVDRQIDDVELPWNHGRRYLQSPKSGAHLRVAVGLLSKEGYFAPIAHSSLVRVPPAEPQPGTVEWMEVVPARGRGRQREPLVIVRRGAGHDERGIRSSDVGDEARGTSPSAGRRGFPGAPFGGSSSPTGKRPGAK